MATKYDIERLLSDIKSLLTSNLNTKLSEIDTEKGDFSLRQVQSSAYFLQEMNNKQANFDPFILYGVENIETVSQRGGSIQRITIQIILVLADNGQDESIANRMLRYQRAMKEVIEENFALSENSINLEVQSLMPVSFENLNTSERCRAIGVNVLGVLGG